MFKHVLVSILILTSIYTIEVEDHVLVLNDANIDEALATYPNILIEFYAPWCGHCKSLAPQYAEAAKALNKDQSKVKLGKVDVTQNDAVGQRYNIQGFPTLYYFQNGNKIQYNGGRTSSQILSWLVKVSHPVTNIIQNQQTLNKILSSNDVKVIFYGSGDSAQFRQFFYASLSQDQITFYQVTDATLLQGRAVPSIIAYTPSQKKKQATYSGNYESNLISEWVQSSTMPSIIPFTGVAINAIFQGGNQGLIVLNNGNTENLFNILEKYCPQQEFILFCSDAKAEHQYRDQLIDWLGITYTAEDQSKILLVNAETSQTYFYQGKVSQITEELFLEFYEGYKAGTLVEHIKPENEHDHDHDHQHDHHGHHDHTEGDEEGVYAEEAAEQALQAQARQAAAQQASEL